MTSLEGLFAWIESPRFAALVNVASDLKTFLRAVDAQPEVRQLSAAVSTPVGRAAVLQRVDELAAHDFDREHENPGDAALAAYLWLLRRNRGAAIRAAAKVWECPRCWWARRVAGESAPLSPQSKE